MSFFILSYQILTMRFSLLAIVILSFTILSCENKSEPQQKEDSTSSLINQDKPENTVRSWQYLMDNNDFDQAKRLADKKTIEFLSEFQQYIETLPEDTLTSNSKFISLSCSENRNKAICFAKIEDLNFQETYNDTFFLIKQDNKWLIATND